MARGGDRIDSARKPRTGFQVVAALAILLLALALRVARLEEAHIWWDEGWSVWVARQGWWAVAERSAHDVHPPLHLWILHLWIRLAGESEFAVRYLSVMAGTATVASLWDLGRLLLPRARWMPVLGALLLALSRFHLWWSQETRMYVLGGLFATLSLSFAARMRRKVTRGAVAGYLITTLAALWTLYLLAFLLIIHALYWLVVAWRERDDIRRVLRQWLLLQGSIFVLFLPWLLYALPRMRGGSAGEASFDIRLYLELYGALLLLGISTNVERYLPLLLGTAVLLGGALFLWRARGAKRRETGDFLTLSLLALLLPPIALWLVTMLPRSVGYLPRPEARYMLPFAPPFYLLLAWGAGQAARGMGRAGRALNALLAAGLLLVFLWNAAAYLEGRYRADEYESVALTLQAHARPGDVVVLHTDEPWPEFAYHWDAGFHGTPHLQEADAGGADYFLAPLWQEHEALWLVINPDALRVDPQHLFEQWLAGRAVARTEWRAGVVRLLLFARTPERAGELQEIAPGFTPPPPANPLATEDGALVGWEQPQRRARAGDIVSAAAFIEGGEAGETLHAWLGDPPVARAEATLPPARGIARVPLSLHIPPGTPGGAATWYLSFDGEVAPQGYVEILPAGQAAPVASVDPGVEVEATFGEPPLARLLGYDLGGRLRPGETVDLTLYWEVEGATPLSYKVFTHLINEEGRVAAQRDDVPLRGTRPTNTWREGEILVDRYVIPLGADLPAGSYRLTVGLYDALSGARLSPAREAGEAQPDDQIVLTTVRLQATE